MIHKTDVLIVTATELESRAVMKVFREATGKDSKTEPIGDRIYLDLGEVNGGCVFMALSEIGSGGLGGSQEGVRKGIEALSPSAVIMVGIAFGINEQKQAIGDVLVSERLMLYDLQRVGTDKEGNLEIIPRGDRPHASPSLINRLRVANLSWDGSKAKVRFGPVLSGDKLADNIDFRTQLLKFEPEAIGGEMEGAGLYVACENSKVDWILVKAICDWADGQKAKDKDDRQQLAAHNAAALVLHALQQAPFKRDREPYLRMEGLPITPTAGATSEPPVEPERGDWYLAHPYPMPPNFTGRAAERTMLTGWLNGDAAHPLLVMRALGGFGKSALAWHWLMHDVDPATWPRVVWWSFYEGDASFDHFLERSLDYLKTGDPAQFGPRQRVDALLKTLHQPGTLLVLDGFERALRAFGGLDAAYRGDEGVAGGNDCDCISPLAEEFLCHIVALPDIRSRVLLTTRLRPRVLEARGGGLLQGCREDELRQMDPADAVAFFRAQGVCGTRAEIEQACAAYGYHPLSLRLLAGLILGDFQQPGDIAAADRLDVSGDLVARRHHVLEAAYNSLTPARQTLLSRIACFRGPVSYDTLRALAEEAKDPAAALDTDLRDLVARGLLHHDTVERRFDLHPIVRHYAYGRLAARDRAAAHTRLRDYFAAVPPPDRVTCLEDLAPVIEFYYHTVRAGRYDEARTLYRDRLAGPIYFQLGTYQLVIDLLRALFPDGEDPSAGSGQAVLPRLKDEEAQAWTLNELANSYGHSGQPSRAVPLFERQIAIREKQGVKRSVATGLVNVATQQLAIGALRAAEANLRRSIALCREVKEEFRQAVGHAELGLLLAYRGAYAGSETELATALKMFEKPKNTQAQGVVRAYRAQREILLLRPASRSAIHHSQSALDPARRALELADEDARTSYPLERDYVRAHWVLGGALRVAGQTGQAEGHLDQALERCRRISNVESEADILIDLARLRATDGAPGEAQRLVEEALVITERSGYVLQGADAHLELAKLALARNDSATALDHAKEARCLATCDGPPDYTYKAAYDEAGALLAELEPHPKGRGAK